MTLILSSIRPADVIITSDGRSIQTRDKRVLSVKDDLQKIFPVPDHPVAVAHHGENMLDGKPVGQWITDLSRRMNVGNLSIEEIADELRARLHAAVRRRLRETAAAGNGFGLVVAGFAAQQREPAWIEVFWSLKKSHVLTEEQKLGPVSICTSGSGASQIPKTDLREVTDKSPADVSAYHRKLMQAAIDARPDANTVGGHVHELVITREACRWTREPKSP